MNSNLQVVFVKNDSKFDDTMLALLFHPALASNLVLHDVNCPPCFDMPFRVETLRIQPYDPNQAEPRSNKHEGCDAASGKKDEQRMKSIRRFTPMELQNVHVSAAGEWCSSSLAIVSPKAFARASICSPRFPTWSCKLKSPPRIVCRPSLHAPRIATCTCSKKALKSSALYPALYPAVNMQPNHFCATPGRTFNVIPCSVVIVEGGWVWLVKTTILSAFSRRPTSDSSATKLSNALPTSKADRAKSKVSSANRKSMRCGIPSDKSKPRSPTFNLHFRIADCNTAPVMLNFVLRPDDPMTCPNCPSYNFEIIQTMCSEMPCSRRLFQSAGQWTRSNAFGKSKFTTHTGIPTAKVLPQKTFAVNRWSSMRFPRRKPCCSSGWWSSSWCSILSRTRHANTL